MLLGRPDTGAQRLLLPDSERHLDRRLLPGADHHPGPRTIARPIKASPKTAKPDTRRCRTAPAAMTVTSAPTVCPASPGKSLARGRVPRSQWRLRAGAGRAVSARPAPSVATVIACRLPSRLVRPAKCSIATVIACRLREPSCPAGIRPQRSRRLCAASHHRLPTRRGAHARTGVCVTSGPSPLGRLGELVPIRPRLRVIPQPRQFRPGPVFRAPPAFGAPAPGPRLAAVAPACG